MYECVRPDTSWRHPVKDGVTWRISSACMCVWMWLCVWMCVPRYNPVKDGMTWRIPVASRVPWITIIHPFSLSIIHYNPKQYNNSSFLIINRMRIRYMVYGKWYVVYGWHVFELMVAWQGPPVEDKHLNKLRTLLPQHVPTAGSFKPFLRVLNKFLK